LGQEAVGQEDQVATRVAVEVVVANQSFFSLPQSFQEWHTPLQLAPLALLAVPLLMAVTALVPLASVL